jgi:iron(III) transport system substrate-binding protein
MKRVGLCSAILTGVMFVASLAAAQDAALVQAAKKEGLVVWYTSVALPTATAIAHGFKEKYTGIDVEVHRTGSERVLQRFMQEAAAGIKNGDIIDTSDAGHFELLKSKGMLLKFTPQGVAGFSDGFKDKAGFYHGMRSTH